MDLTETYTKQCDCPEIQGLVISLKKHHDNHTYWHRKIPLRESIQDFLNNSIWLPKQDEIQGLFDEEWFNSRGWIKDWETLFDCMNNFGHSGEFETPERAWLAFYMKSKHGLEWDGSKWRGVK